MCLFHHRPTLVNLLFNFESCLRVHEKHASNGIAAIVLIQWKCICDS